MKIREFIKILMEQDIEDDLYINVPNSDGDPVYYVVDGLENHLFEYRKNPTISVCLVS